MFQVRSERHCYGGPYGPITASNGAGDSTLKQARLVKEYKTFDKTNANGGFVVKCCKLDLCTFMYICNELDFCLLVTSFYPETNKELDLIGLCIPQKILQEPWGVST